MNAFKTITGYALVVLTAGLLNGCSKDDTSAPVITILGDDPYELEMLDTYVDPGATAEDDEDGDVSSSIIVDESDINENLPGSYSVNYSVTDAAGNEGTASRGVTVYATPGALADVYTVVDTVIIGSADTVFTYPQTITAVNSTTIRFSKFGNYTPNAGNPVLVDATLNANGTITIPSQTLAGIGTNNQDHTFQGTGYVTNTGIYLSYTDINISAGNLVLTRKAHFTR